MGSSVEEWLRLDKVKWKVFVYYDLSLAHSCKDPATRHEIEELVENNKHKELQHRLDDSMQL